MTIHKVEWPGCSFIIDSFAGRLRQLKLTMVDGRVVEPLAEAHWNASDPENEQAEMILDGLGGNWFCLPFGMAEAPATLDSRWKDDEAPRPCSHGETSCNAWGVEVLDDVVILTFEFPEDHEMATVRREIRRVENGVEFKTTVVARVATSISMGHHPILAMPETPGSLTIDFPDGIDQVFTYPVQFEYGVSVFAHEKVYDSLEAIETVDGEVVNASMLPCLDHAEELVVVKPKAGRVQVTNKPGGFVSEISWELDKLPGCLLWMSMNGRTEKPWDGKFYGLGVEPICGAFDLGLGVSRRLNPLNDYGLATAIEMSPDQPFEDTLTIRCQSL